MASKVKFWSLLRLAILLAAFLAQSSEGATYRDFKNRHIDSEPSGTNRPSAYCNNMMRRRGMTGRICKATNTFIHSSEHTIRDICHRGGTLANRNLFDSSDKFNLMTCRLTRRRPTCIYSGRRQRRRIRLACDRRRPVHFDRIL